MSNLPGFTCPLNDVNAQGNMRTDATGEVTNSRERDLTTIAQQEPEERVRREEGREEKRRGSEQLEFAKRSPVVK